MGFDIKYPHITGRNDTEKIEQIRSYLIQLADELKWALNSSDGGESSKGAAPTQTEAVSAQNTFNAVKALIMNSNDILNAYYNKLDKKFAENYVSLEDLKKNLKDGKLDVTEAIIKSKLTLGQYVLDPTKNLDFVTETGKSGDWQYQKYHSGFIVAYGSFTANYKCNTAHGSGFYAPGTFTLPSGMFGSILNIASSVVADGIRGITITSATKDTINASIYSMKEDTAEIPIRIDLTVTGWKNTAGG